MPSIADQGQLVAYAVPADPFAMLEELAARLAIVEEAVRWRANRVDTAVTLAQLQRDLAVAQEKIEALEAAAAEAAAAEPAAATAAAAAAAPAVATASSVVNYQPRRSKRRRLVVNYQQFY